VVRRVPGEHGQKPLCGGKPGPGVPGQGPGKEEVLSRYVRLQPLHQGMAGQKPHGPQGRQGEEHGEEGENIPEFPEKVHDLQGV